MCPWIDSRSRAAMKDYGGDLAVKIGENTRVELTQSGSAKQNAVRPSMGEYMKDIFGTGQLGIATNFAGEIIDGLLYALMSRYSLIYIRAWGMVCIYPEVMKQYDGHSAFCVNIRISMLSEYGVGSRKVY